MLLAAAAFALWTTLTSSKKKKPKQKTPETSPKPKQKTQTHKKTLNKNTWSKLPIVKSLVDPTAGLWVRGDWESLTGCDHTEFPYLDSAKHGSIVGSIQMCLLSSSSPAYKRASGKRVDAKRGCPVQRQAVDPIACQVCMLTTFMVNTWCGAERD